MRDILVTFIVFGLLPFVLLRPSVGILLWSWLSYMNPHRLTWGFAYSMPFAQIVAICLLISLFNSKEPKRIPVTALTVTWWIFLAWMGITTIMSMFPDRAYELAEKVFKIQLVTFLTIMVMRTPERIKQLVWIIVLSIGYYGTKGGVFTIIRGGQHRVYGPPDSFITDNNYLSCALLMILPLMWHLRRYSPNKWIRLGLALAMLLVGLSIVGSYSRGAFVAGGVVLIFLWLKTHKKMLSGGILLIFVVGLLAFMPEKWHERMDSIATYEEDSSAMNRIRVWEMTVNLADNRPFGAGFDPWGPVIDALYAGPNYDKAGRAAHSVYFGVLGEHGWVGLVLLLLVLFLGWRAGTWIIRQCKNHEELREISDLTKMIQVSFVAFASGGMFISIAYFDLFWHLMAILVINKALVQDRLRDWEERKVAERRRFKPVTTIASQG